MAGGGGGGGGGDEEPQPERFDMDNDYEGGKWVDGEFYYKSKRQKRVQTRDDQLYGVFADDSDDSGGGSRRRRRRDDGDGGGAERDYTRPVSFVSTGRVVQDTTRDDEEEDEGGERRRRGGIGAGPSKAPDQDGMDDAAAMRPSFASMAPQGRGGLGLGAGGGPGGLGLAPGNDDPGGRGSGEEEEEEEAVLPSAFGRR